jgi:transcriptional regulator with XRE-family HTH domain
MRFHEHLKKLRQDLGYTQEQMAELLNIDRSTYCRLEHNPDPPLHYVERISMTFKVDAYRWLRPEEIAEAPAQDGSASIGPKILHMPDLDQAAHERHWRSRAVDILGQITNLMADLLKNTRGGANNQ